MLESAPDLLDKMTQNPSVLYLRYLLFMLLNNSPFIQIPLMEAALIFEGKEPCFLDDGMSQVLKHTSGAELGEKKKLL